MRPRPAHALRGPACTLCDIIKYGYFRQVRLLVSTGINLEARDAAKRTPLILCAFMEPEEWGVSIAMTLIENGVQVWQRDGYGRNALHYSCIYERENLVRVLLQAIDFDLNQLDKMGNTVLHYAAMSGNLPITQLLAQSLKKYKIKADKTLNHRGKTAQEEAKLAGNSACAQAIQLEVSDKRPGSAVKDVRFAEDVILDSEFSRPGLRKSGASSRSRSLSITTADHILSKEISLVSTPYFLPRHRPGSRSSLASSRRLTLRPTMADTFSSVSSVDGNPSPLFPRGQPSTSLPFKHCHRKVQQPLYAYGYKMDAEIIRCAPDCDFRNKPLHVFKLVQLPRDPETCSTWPLIDPTNRKSNACDLGQSQRPAKSHVGWRNHLQELFKVYEHQCSASWRPGKRTEGPPVLGTLIPNTPSPEEDEKIKKGGRQSSNGSRNSQIQSKESSQESKRRTSTVRLRRMNSALSKSLGGACASMGGSLNTSSESINSLASSKRRGLEKEAGIGRSESLTLKPRRKQSRDAFSPAYSSTPTPSPSTAKALALNTTPTIPALPEMEDRELSSPPTKYGSSLQKLHSSGSLTATVQNTTSVIDNQPAADTASENTTLNTPSTIPALLQIENNEVSYPPAQYASFPKLHSSGSLPATEQNITSVINTQPATDTASENTTLNTPSTIPALLQKENNEVFPKLRSSGSVTATEQNTTSVIDNQPAADTASENYTTVTTTLATPSDNNSKDFSFISDDAFFPSRIPVVKETLVGASPCPSSIDEPQEVDANKLWVPHSYNGDQKEDIFDEQK